jgi:serine/threonine-protein kinase
MTGSGDDSFDSLLRRVAASPEVPLAERSDASRRVGTVLGGKYHIDAVLGIGGMADVYRATHRNGAQRAIKVLRPEHSSNEDLRRRFRREGRFANAVQHPGTVSVIDDDVTEDGVAFLVLELLEGIACDQLCIRCGGRLPTSAACAVALQVLEVLQAAHDKGIIHRDIKPANLFVLHNGMVKVLDFGIARLREAVAGNPQATKVGVHLGTPAFMAPEQAMGAADIDERTDVWAVGATLFTMLSGTFVGRSGSQLGTLAPAVPKRLVEVIARALEFEAADRWQSAGAMRKALAEASRPPFGGEPPGQATLATLLASAEPRSGEAPPAESGPRVSATLPAVSPSASPGRSPAVPDGSRPGAEARPDSNRRPDADMRQGPMPAAADDAGVATPTLRSGSPPRGRVRPVVARRPLLWLAGAALLGLGAFAILSNSQPRAPSATPETSSALRASAPPPVPEEPESATAANPSPPASGTSAGVARKGGLPQSCADARAGGASSDGTIRIDPDGAGPLHPFEVYCAGMAGGLPSDPPREYLTLAHSAAQGEQNENATTYVWRGGACDCPDLVRTFFRVRIHPRTMTIDPTDGTFALYNRPLLCEERHRSQCGESMQLGWGAPGSCRAAGDASGSATINLRGTPFALAPAVRFVPAGFSATGHAEVSKDRKAAELHGGGMCGALVPEQGTIALVESR